MVPEPKPQTALDRTADDPHGRTCAQGIAIITAVFALLLLSIIGLAVAFSGILEVQSSSNYEHALTAFYIADAGMNHAFREIAAHSLSFNTILKGADSVENTADDGYLQFESIPESERIPAAGLTFGSGHYIARATDDTEADSNPAVDTNQRIVLTSQGFGPDGSTATIEAIVALGGGIPAIVSGGDLTISGNPLIEGTWGGVHANDDLTISGNPTVTQDATCSDVYTESGSPTIGGVSGGNRPPVQIPTIDAESHRSQADYILSADGKVRDQAGTVLADTTGGTSFRGWRRTSETPVEWTSNTNQNDYFPGSYFVEGNATLSGKIGSNTVTVPLTVIAKGDIKSSGSADVRPESGDIFLLADGDIQITGDLDQSDQNYAGFIATHEQLYISGNPTLVGHIVIEDAANNSSLVTSNNIAGNVHITATGGFTSIGPTGTPLIISWRELRN